MRWQIKKGAKPLSLLLIFFLELIHPRYYSVKPCGLKYLSAIGFSLKENTFIVFKVIEWLLALCGGTCLRPGFLKRRNLLLSKELN